jgi:hypothetical protein
LGYGDGDEATVVSFGGDANNKFITTYFRHSFVVPDPSGYTNLILRLLRDDGAVVYLNGTEVTRSNMPSGTINSTTLASSTVSGTGETTYYSNNISLTSLVAGTNVLAVEVHQDIATGVDLSFDLELIGLARVSAAPTISNVGDLSTSEDTPVAVAFTVADPDTAPLGLTTTASSSNPALVASTNIFFDGFGTNRMLTIVPTTNQFGTALITVMVSDGLSSASDSFTLTVNAVNDPPTLDPLPSFAVRTGQGDQTFTVTGIGSGALNETQTLSLSAVSSDPGIVTIKTVSYTSPNPSGTIRLDYANGPIGSATVTMTVSDGQAQNNTTSHAFIVNLYASGNASPTVSAIANQVTLEDTPTPPIPFTVSDTGTSANLLTVTGFSSNTNLVPNNNIVFGGSGSSRTVSLIPASNQIGSATITLTVSDTNFGLTSTNFLLTVNPVNDPPTISDVADRSVTQGASTGVIPFTVGDMETPAANLTVTASSSNQNLVPTSNVTLGGSGTNRALSITPGPNQTGLATITVSVTDGATNATDTFVLTVIPGINPPTISDIADQTTAEDTAVGPVAFTIGDTETPAGSLTLSATSSNPALVPSANVTFGGSGASRTLTVAPLTNQFGTAVITVTVTDADTNTASDSFLLTVNPVNEPPKLDGLTNLFVNADAGPQIVNLSGIGTGATSENQTLAVSAVSGNPALVPDPSVAYTSPAAVGTLTFTPVITGSGAATITVTVNDGQAQDNLATRIFTVTVNGLPSISDIADRTTQEGAVAGPIAFTIGDPETPASSLSLSATSSNTGLLRNTDIAFAGSGSNRTVTLTPVAGQTGTTLIAIRVTDTSGASATENLTLRVDPAPAPPVITQQPQGRTVPLGREVTFTVLATGSSPLSFQWQRDGSALSGQTNPTLLLSTVQPSDAGDYIVTVSNAYGAVTSAPAVLIVQTQHVIVAIEHNGGTSRIFFTTELGLSHTVEYKDDVSDLAWHSLTSVIGTGSVMMVEDSTAVSPLRIYRVRAE